MHNHLNRFNLNKNISTILKCIKNTRNTITNYRNKSKNYIIKILKIENYILKIPKIKNYIIKILKIEVERLFGVVRLFVLKLGYL